MHENNSPCSILKKNAWFQLIFILLKYLRILKTATYKIYLANNEHMP